MSQLEDFIDRLEEKVDGIAYGDTYADPVAELEKLSQRAKEAAKKIMLTRLLVPAGCREILLLLEDMEVFEQRLNFIAHEAQKAIDLIMEAVNDQNEILESRGDLT